MKTREFIEQLRGSRGKQVLFVDENDMTIHTGYHLTEHETVSILKLIERRFHLQPLGTGDADPAINDLTSAFVTSEQDD